MVLEETLVRIRGLEKRVDGLERAWMRDRLDLWEVIRELSNAVKKLQEKKE